MLRRVLLAASASRRARHVLTTAPVTRDVVRRFVAGDAAGDALAAVERLAARGLSVTLDHLGEHTTDRAQAAAVADEYAAVLGLLAAAGLTAGGRSEVSVKPTAVGLGLGDHGEKTATENIARICAAAREAGTTVTVDMEDHATVEQTLRLVTELRRDFPDLGCVIQSYLRRSAQDCAGLAIPGSRVRLVKGAYRASEAVALGSREVDRNYVRCLRVLMAGRGYPMLATHDPRLVEIAGACALRAGRAADSFEYQMLYGVRTGEQSRLAGDGARVRIYVPYGSDWYGYLMRRLAERPANLAFFLRALMSRR